MQGPHWSRFSTPFSFIILITFIEMDRILNKFVFKNLADLDDTLYPLSSGLATACKNNIHGDFSVSYICMYIFLFSFSHKKYGFFSNLSAYMAEKLGVENSKIPELSNLLYKNYGTTMAGLRVCPFHPI